MIYIPISRETLADVSASTGITAALLPPTEPRVVYAIIQAIGGDIRFTVEGSTPTSSLGLRLPEDEVVEVWGSQALSNFRCIDDGGIATMDVVTMGGAQ